MNIVTSTMRQRHISRKLLFLSLTVAQILVTSVSRVAYAETVACLEDSLCQELQGSGSICSKNGHCTNPFERGCLYQRKEDWNKKRVCNSDDPPNAAADGLCEEPQLDYMEVRIASGNWESIFFNAWVLQIVLSELLGVPTTLEPGKINTRISLYDPTGAVEYGRVDNVGAFANAKKYIDCRLVQRDGGEEEEEEEEEGYASCAHVIPEFWGATGPWATNSINDGTMEPPQSLGVLAQETIFIPKFTAERDPTLLSYIGLQGEKNRQKLADTFLRPTLWSDYCKQESSDGCATPDEVSQRAPIDDEEGNVYYLKDIYTGFFRKTEENVGNATHNATGHIIDYPCDWTSYVEQQMYHLDIALSGDRFGEGLRGYEGWHMVQILSAANATKSNIIIMWAKPDPIFQSLMGTDMEFHPVQLPQLTQECLAQKRHTDNSCSANTADRVGDPRGACEDPPLALHLAISTSLTKYDNEAQEGRAEKSPAVDAIKLYSQNTAIYGSFFNLAIERDALVPERSSLLKDAACHWAVENFDILERFVPFSYPRVLRDGEKNSPLVTASIVLGSFAIFMVLAASAIVYKYRDRRVIVYAQIDFLWLLLIGLLMMSIGALLFGVPPTTGTCISALWFVNIGFTVSLAPLLVKVSAINRLTRASQRMSKIKLKRQNLFGTVFVVTSVMVIFLIFWTVMDTPEVKGELFLTTKTTENGETLVYRTNYCSSQSVAWQYVAFGWMGVLLLSATVLAIEMRNVRQEFNESLTLGIVAYSHFVFGILRVACYFLSDTLGKADSVRYRSILFSVDAMATLIIYFLPKFVVLRRGENVETMPQESSRSGFMPKSSGNSEPSVESRTKVHFAAEINKKRKEFPGGQREQENGNCEDDQFQKRESGGVIQRSNESQGDQGNDMGEGKKSEGDSVQV